MPNESRREYAASQNQARPRRRVAVHRQTRPRRQENQATLRIAAMAAFAHRATVHYNVSLVNREHARRTVPFRREQEL